MTTMAFRISGEPGIAGVTVTLSGTDDLGNVVNISLITDANGNYQFTNVRPSDAAGYTLSETQPTDYNDGLDQDGSLANGDATVNDVVSSINVDSGDNGTGYDFAEQGTSIWERFMLMTIAMEFSMPANQTGSAEL